MTESYTDGVFFLTLIIFNRKSKANNSRKSEYNLRNGINNMIKTNQDIY